MFISRMSLPNGIWLSRVTGPWDHKDSVFANKSILKNSMLVYLFSRCKWFYAPLVKLFHELQKNLPGLQFIMPDAMSLVRPPNSNGRTTPLTCIFYLCGRITLSHKLLQFSWSRNKSIRFFKFKPFRILNWYMPINYKSILDVLFTGKK